MTKALTRGTAFATAILTVLVLAGYGHAAALFRADLQGGAGAARFQGESVATAQGTGWRSSVDSDDVERFDAVEYAVAPGRDFLLDRGVIDIHVRNDRSGGPTWDGGSTYNTLFTLLDNDNRRLMTAYILWEFRGNHAVSGLAFDSDIRDAPARAWGRWVPFPFKVGRGETVHLEIRWGTDGNRIFINGAEVPAYYGRFDGVADAPADTAPRDGSIAQLLGQASRLVIGSDVFQAGSEGTKREEGSFALYNSTLSSFAILDEPGPLAPEIVAVNHDAARAAGFSGRLVAGDIVTVTLEGTPGATANFDVPRLAGQWGEIGLSWKGWGVYMEDKTFFEEGEVDLRNVEEYRVYADTKPLDLGGITADTVFVEALDKEVQSYTLDGLVTDEAYYVAVGALMRDDSIVPVILPKQRIAMTEVQAGTYEGAFTAGYGDVYPTALVVGRLSSGAEKKVLRSDEEFEIDTRLNIEVTTTPEELRADETSTAEVTVTVTDVNGDAVPDHEVRFLLATTSQYTGVVGGGAFDEETGGAIDLKRRFRSKTDLFGRVKATYTAGFAAKTAIIVARDMASNDTGAGYIKTYIEASADLVLEQELTAERSKALAGYKMTVTSSAEWLTADGESEARITAHVTLNGQPVEGHRVGFGISSGTGSIRTVSGTTGGNGKARAVYTAGTKIGIVTIEAIDHTIGLVGTVQIELRSDAPAKITITLKPELLFADGRSTADVEVLVTDIHDNPNEGVTVGYGILVGSGKLQRIEEITDRRGVSTAEYVAGRIPGRVTIGVTVRSTAPADEELLAARDLALAVLDYDFY